MSSYDMSVILFMFVSDIQEKDEWREVVKERLLQPTFPDEDTVIFPDDPLGRDGPW
jgi:hypothetical protein